MTVLALPLDQGTRPSIFRCLFFTHSCIRLFMSIVIESTSIRNDEEFFGKTYENGNEIIGTKSAFVTSKSFLNPLIHSQRLKPY